jgi:hypothetical protein
MLDEEADALNVEALVGAGRRDEAQSERDRFVRRHPDSLFRGRVEAAVQAPP